MLQKERAFPVFPIAEQTSAGRRLRGNEQERRQAPLGCVSVCEAKRKRGGMSEPYRERYGEGYAAHADAVKLERAQGECLGIRSRRRT